MCTRSRRFFVLVVTLVLVLGLATTTTASSAALPDPACDGLRRTSAGTSPTRELASSKRRRTVSPNVTVTLTGRIRKTTYIFDGKRSRVPVIVLSRAIDVRADDGWGPAMKVTKMQLAINGNYKSFMKKHLGHKVRLTGEVYYGGNQNHFTEVSVLVKRAKNR